MAAASTPKAIAAWLCVTHLVCYPLVRVALTRWGWKQKAKTPAQHKDDLLRGAYLAIALGLVGRVCCRLMGGGKGHGVLFVALLVYYLSFFSLLFELARKVDVKLSRDLADNAKACIVALISCSIIALVLWNQIRIAQASGSGGGFVVRRS